MWVHSALALSRTCSGCVSAVNGRHKWMTSAAWSLGHLKLLLPHHWEPPTAQLEKNPHLFPIDAHH